MFRKPITTDSRPGSAREQDKGMTTNVDFDLLRQLVAEVIHDHHTLTNRLKSLVEDKKEEKEHPSKDDEVS
jgi:hypothetical protein